MPNRMIVLSFLTTIPPIVPNMGFVGDTVLEQIIDIVAGLVILSAVLSVLIGAFAVLGGRTSGNYGATSWAWGAILGGAAAVGIVITTVPILNYVLGLSF